MKSFLAQLLPILALAVAGLGQSVPPGAGATEQDGGSPLPASSVDARKDTPPKGTSNDRILFTLPNFLTLENAGNTPPLSVGEKFKVAARSTFDPAQFLWYGFQTGISEGEDSEVGYGHGAQGFAKRYAANFANGTIENMMTAAVFPSLLHQDPRYYQSGHGGFWRRTRHAVGHIFVTRTDSGSTQLNYSEFLGSASQAGISTFTYLPRGDRNISTALSVWGTQVGYDALSYAIKEFWPDLRRKMHKDK